MVLWYKIVYGQFHSLFTNWNLPHYTNVNAEQMGKRGKHRQNMPDIQHTSKSYSQLIPDTFSLVIFCGDMMALAKNLLAAPLTLKN